MKNEEYILPPSGWHYSSFLILHFITFFHEKTSYFTTLFLLSHTLCSREQYPHSIHLLRMANRPSGSQQTPFVARPQVWCPSSLGHLFRARYRGELVYLRRGVGSTRHHNDLSAIQGLVLGTCRSVQPHSVQSFSVGRSHATCRDEIYDFHHQAPRWILYV